MNNNETGSKNPKNAVDSFLTIGVPAEKSQKKDKVSANALAEINAGQAKIILQMVKDGTLDEKQGKIALAELQKNLDTKLQPKGIRLRAELEPSIEAVVEESRRVLQDEEKQGRCRVISAGVGLSLGTVHIDGNKPEDVYLLSLTRHRAKIDSSGKVTRVKTKQELTSKKSSQPIAV